VGRPDDLQIERRPKQWMPVNAFGVSRSSRSLCQSDWLRFIPGEMHTPRDHLQKDKIVTGKLGGG